MKNELQTIIEQEKIIPTQAEFLLENFKAIFEKAKELEVRARVIKVDNVEQKEEMQKARELRIEIKNLRCEANNKREELKAESLRTGKAIQGFYNVIEALTKPMESYLEEQEKFAEKIEAQKKLQKAKERQNLLSKFVEDVSLYNLSEMSEAGFQELLRASELAYNTRIEAEKKAEAEKVKAEKEREAENERIRIENEKLRKEQAEKDALIAKQQQEKEALIKKQQAELAEEKRKRDEQEAKIAKEAKEKLENEQREAELKRKAEIAPDKDKLAKLANDLILMQYPELKDKTALEILENVKALIQKVNLYIVKNINNL